MDSQSLFMEPNDDQDFYSPSVNGSLPISNHAGAARVMSTVSLPSENAVEKQDDRSYFRNVDSNSTGQLDQESISVTIVDSEGPRIYFEKPYKLGLKDNTEKALDQIRSHVCILCSKSQMLDFWFAIKELENGQTAALVGIQDGDTIDIHLKEACTRGTHPVPFSQNSPNMHHLDASRDAILTEDTRPPARKATINLTFRNDIRFAMRFRIGVDQAICKACESFEIRLGMSEGQCRFHAEGLRLDRMKTPKELELEDEDIVECYMEMIGGSPESEMMENFSRRLEARPWPAVYVEQITLIFEDGYRHRFSVAVANDSRLQQAFRYVAHRMAKNPDHIAFKIEGRSFDFKGLGTKSPMDLAIETGTVIEVRYVPSKPSTTNDPDDSLSPRSIRYCVRPIETQNKAQPF